MDKLERNYRSNDRQHHLRIAETNIPHKVNENTDTRKCMTPCLTKSKPKSKQSKLKYTDVMIMMPQQAKDRNKSTERRQDSKSRRKTDSKLKNRPSSTMANPRISKQLQNYQQNFNETGHKIEFKLDEDISMVRIKDISFKNLDNRHISRQLIALLNEGKKYLKNSNFQRAQQCFKEASKYPEGNSVQVLYLYGVCSFHLQNYHQAIRCLNSVLLQDDGYRKNVFFFLAISYKRIGDIQSAIQILTITIIKSPKNYEALLFRGKLLAREKKYRQSISDFNKCIALEPTKIAPIVSKADALRGLADLEQASQLYSQALAKYPSDTNIRLKRAHCFLQLQKLQLSQTDLDEILKIEPCHSQAYYFKGAIFYKNRNYNDALLSFEQAIKHNSSKKATTKALYQIAKIKIELRDFYGASYTLERADSLDVDRKILQKIKLFVDGSTFLMKKKTKKGVELLSNLIKKQSIPQFIKSQTFSFRAYGYFCQYKYTHALNDLITLEKMGSYLDEASNYNNVLLEGIIAVQNGRFNQALLKFQQGERMKPTIADPNIYKALTFITIYNRASMSEKTTDVLEQAIKACSAALAKQEGNWNCSFIRATIYYTLKDYQKALSDIENAVDKSDDHVIKHFYLRAMIYASMEKYKQALGDFSNVDTLMKDLRQKSMQSRQDQTPQRQKEMPEAYLHRAKCYLLFGEKRRAFQDLQKYISYRPLDPQIHIMAGRLLFSIGASEDAVKAYSNCTNIQANLPVLLQRVKCYLLLKELNFCLKDMQKIVDSGDTKMKFDYVCLDSLRQSSKNTIDSLKSALKNIQSVASNTQGGHIFQKADYYFYLGVYMFYIKNYHDALKSFLSSMQLKIKNRTLQEITNTEEDNQDMYDNRIFTADQLKYNIGVTYLMLNNKQEALKILQNYKYFKQIIALQQTPTFSFQPDIPMSQRSEKESDITPFPTSNRLCSIFPSISVGNYEFRLSFCLPKVQPPETELKVEEQLIQKLTINCTQARPDAPWIKRNNFGVVFTQDLMGCDVDLDTEQEQNSVHHHYRQDEISEPSNRQQEKRRLKQALLLDPAIEARLAKMMN